MVLRSEILVNKNVMPTAEQALPGRETPMSLPEFHYVFKDTPLLGPFFEGAIDFAWDLLTSGQQLKNRVRSDDPRSAGDENRVHGSDLSRGAPLDRLDESTFSRRSRSPDIRPGARRCLGHRLRRRG